MAANAELKLGEESSGPTALLMPVPTDGGAGSLDQLRADVAAAKGSAVLLESTSSGWDEGRSKGTLNDWGQRRLGPDIQQQLRELHKDALHRIANACGIPAGLFALGVASTQSREDYRRFVMLTVEPLAKELAAEASLKLDDPVEFGHSTLCGPMTSSAGRPPTESCERRAWTTLNLAGWPDWNSTFHHEGEHRDRRRNPH